MEFSIKHINGRSVRWLQSLKMDDIYVSTDDSRSGWADFIRQARHARSFIQKKVELNQQNINNIREHKSTIRINYYSDFNDGLTRNGFYADAYDYVGKLYPSVGVKAASVYYSPASVLAAFGFAGVGGFYDIESRIVVITDCIDSYQTRYKADFTLDEVLCHELIHYAANFKQPVASRELEEEIAYGYSIKYLQTIKNRSDDFIIRKNLFPYLITVVDKGKVYQKVLTSLYSPAALAKSSEEALKLLVVQNADAVAKGIEDEAYNIGMNMIKLYGIAKEIDTLKPSSKVILDVDDEF